MPDFKPGFAGRVRRRAAARRPDAGKRDGRRGADRAAVWQPVLEAAGAFDSITKTTVGGKDGYGVAVVQAKYENAAVTFTLSYTPEGKLGGLFFK